MILGLHAGTTVVVTLDQLSQFSNCIGTTLRSQLYSPSNPGNGYSSYEWLRSSVNNRIQSYPIAVLLIPSTNYVSLAVQCAQANGIQPVIRSGGHSYAGLSSATGKLLIDLSYCNAVTSIFFDPISGKQKATFEAGIRLGKLYTDLWNGGQWSFNAGECAWVGAGGHLTGGGQGMQSRLYGLAIDQITSMEVVLADGSQVTADANTHADLFWALRGAGSGSFGVVLRFTVNVFQMPQNSMFRINFQQTTRMFALWQSFFLTLPNELSAYMHLEKNNFYINGHFLGPMASLRALLAPVLADSAVSSSVFQSCSGLGARSFVQGDLSCSQAAAFMSSTSPLNPAAKSQTKAKSDFVSSLLPEWALQTLVSTVAAGPFWMGSHLLGGTSLTTATSTIAGDATAYPGRAAWFCVDYGTWGSYQPGQPAFQGMNAIQAALAPFAMGLKYYNYLDVDFAAAAYFGSNFNRLMAVKKRYDPNNWFNGVLSVPLPPPSTDPTALPSLQPTVNKAISPSMSPSVSPFKLVSSSASPSIASTKSNSAKPSVLSLKSVPSVAPTAALSSISSKSPTAKPTTISPSVCPSLRPSTAQSKCTNVKLSQCGGRNFVKSTCCPAGSCCTYANLYWSDCQPSAAAGCAK